MLQEMEKVGKKGNGAREEVTLGHSRKLVEWLSTASSPSKNKEICQRTTQDHSSPIRYAVLSFGLYINGIADAF